MIVIQFRHGSATIHQGEWHATDSGLLALCKINAQIFPDEGEYVPNLDLAAAQRVVDSIEGAFISYQDIPAPLPYVVY